MRTNRDGGKRIVGGVGEGVGVGVLDAPSRIAAIDGEDSSV
jgi:hypothetical protein